MGKSLMKIIWLFRKFFIRQGVDAAQLMTIVETKLVMDQRRVYMNWKQSQQKENKNHLRVILISYLVYGLFIGFFLYFIPNLLAGMIIAHGFILFMMCMTLVTDFSTVLLDTTDNQIILPRPVSSKTFFMARLVHIIAYILQFSLALALIPILITFYKYGALTGIVFIFTFLLIILTAVFITYILYLFLIRVTSVAKIREVITYFQIFMTIIFVAGFQILPRVVGIADFSTDFKLHAYSFFLPPFWMAYTVDAFHNLQFDLLHLAMIALAIIVPPVCFFILIKYLAPSFSKKLAGMESSSDTTGNPDARPGRTISSFFSRWACLDPVERSSFGITWKITSRDKPFRLQFYPSLAYILIFVFFFIFRGNTGSFSNGWEQLPLTDKYLWFVYLPVMTVTGALALISYNENYQASWIYYSLPVKQPGFILSGSVKALFFKYFLSLYVILFAFALYVWGTKIIPDFVLGLFNDALCFLVIAFLSQHYLPFSRQPRTQQQTGKLIRMIVQIAIMTGLISLHFLVLHLPYVKYILMPLALTACWLLLTSIQQLKWEKIAV